MSPSLERSPICPLKRCRLDFPQDLKLRDGVVILGSIEILRRFELIAYFDEIDTLPQFLHKTLTSISSHHFREFSLRLRPGLDSDLNPGPKTVPWGAGWEVVDEDLSAHAARRGNFRFVVEIPFGESAKATVEALFPQMKSKGWLLIEWQKEYWEW